MNGILAVDPGGTTGIAWLEDGKARKDIFGSMELGTMLALDFIDEALRSGRFIDVVVESFVPRPGIRTWQPEAIESIGAIRFLARKSGTPFSLQTPAQAKSFATNGKLDKLGWRRPSPGGHRDDAARHLLVRAVAQGRIDAKVFLA